MKNPEAYELSFEPVTREVAPDGEPSSSQTFMLDGVEGKITVTSEMVSFQNGNLEYKAQRPPFERVQPPNYISQIETLLSSLSCTIKP